MYLNEADFIKILVSLLIGAVLGAEREYRSKSAGFRTIILITLGSTLFTIFSLQIGSPNSPDRIASNIVQGIGFLGAGIIFREGSRVNGITTAATIWTSAALGMGVGGGYFLVSAVAVALIILVLFGFTLLERYIDAANQTREYKIVCHFKNETLGHYEQLFKKFNLRYYRGTQSKNENDIIGSWTVSGSAHNHDKLINVLLKDEHIKQFDF